MSHALLTQEVLRECAAVCHKQISSPRWCLVKDARHGLGQDRQGTHSTGVLSSLQSGPLSVSWSEWRQQQPDTAPL